MAAIDELRIREDGFPARDSRQVLRERWFDVVRLLRPAVRPADVRPVAQPNAGTPDAEARIAENDIDVRRR
jgi:hypothetical protein